MSETLRIEKLTIRIHVKSVSKKENRLANQPGGG